MGTQNAFLDQTRNCHHQKFEICASNQRQIICLGDSFAEHRLPEILEKIVGEIFVIICIYNPDNDTQTPFASKRLRALQQLTTTIYYNNNRKHSPKQPLE